MVLQRCRGIGSLLLSLFLDQPHPKFLHVQADNTLARGFYERAGFVAAGPLLPGYYRGLAMSAALRMVKKDEDAEC